MSVKEKIAELEQLEIDDWEASFDSVQKVRAQYPDDFYEKTIEELRGELAVQYKKHWQKLCENYNRLNSYAEKKKYYDEVVLPAERVLNNCLDGVKIKPKRYEAWLNAEALAFMRERGYKETLRFYLIIGAI